MNHLDLLRLLGLTLALISLSLIRAKKRQSAAMTEPKATPTRLALMRVAGAVTGLVLLTIAIFWVSRTYLF